MRHRSILLALSSLLLGSCCSTEHAQKETSREASQQTTPAQGAGPDTSAPTVMKPNFITMTATIDSIIVLDSIRYRLIIRLISASSTEGAEAPNTDQRLVLVPQFVQAKESTEDWTNPRNARLLALRRKHQGDTISGTISLNKQQQWILIDVNEK